MDTKKLQCLNSTHLKLIALITMIIDHIGAVLFPEIRLLRIIGRIAFPIYAYLIGEGCIYSKNKLQYFAKIGITFVAYELVDYLIIGNRGGLCVLYGFMCAVLSVMVIEWAQKDLIKRRPIAVLPIMALFISTLILQSDYTFIAMTIPLVVYWIKNKNIRYGIVEALLFICALIYPGTQWFGMFAIIPIILYNGNKGKEILFKNSFYVMYPLHFAVLGIIKMFL